MIVFALIALVVIGILAFLATWISSKRRGGDSLNSAQDPYIRPSDCCGAHAVCERDSLLPKEGEAVVYYDDEELDAYQGINSLEYTDEMLDKFEEVFSTLLPQDVAGWVRSLQYRGIELPDIIKEQVMFVICENRQQSNK